MKNIYWFNIQISLKKIFFITLRTLSSYYIISEIITCEVSIVKNFYICIYIAGDTLKCTLYLKDVFNRTLNNEYSYPLLIHFPTIHSKNSTIKR